MPIDYATYPKDWKLRSRFVRFYRAKNGNYILDSTKRISGL